MLAGRYVRRALEHDVLEKMGESGATLLFISGTDVIPDADRQDGAMWSGLEMTRSPLSNVCWTIG